MPSIVAVAALPSKSTGITPSANATENPASIASFDFAALLLGQLSPELPADTLASTDVTDPALFAEPVSTPVDPAQFLASMGLAQQAAGILPPDGKTRIVSPEFSETPGASIAPTIVPGTALPGTALPGSNQKPDATLAQSTTEAAETTLLPTATALQGNSPAAKLAGFEQKLADVTQTIAADISSTTPQATTSQQTGPATNALRQGTEAVRVEANLRDHAWPAEFGQKVVWMATQDKQSAQITLNPPQLGPIEISLNVKNDQATAIFSSGNAEVREAIESALPRLREMLAGVGVELGQTNVSSESFRQASEGNNSNRGNNAEGKQGDSGLDIGATHGETMVRTADRRGNGLVDTFA